ncbi:MAG: hypothetical protein HFJ47_01435 [Clostridia bacterium]|nr:hypothetical protein [Clostridia bacterium]
MVVLYILYFLVLVIVALIGYAVLQIKLVGMNVKDFWSFIEANQTLDKLYVLSKRYQNMNAQQQIIFLYEAERMFDAFEKVPSALWEEEYDKYSIVLENYRNIKMNRWIKANA